MLNPQRWEKCGSGREQEIRKLLYHYSFTNMDTARPASIFCPQLGTHRYRAETWQPWTLPMRELRRVSCFHNFYSSLFIKGDVWCQFIDSIMIIFWLNSFSSIFFSCYEVNMYERSLFGNTFNMKPHEALWILKWQMFIFLKF